MPPSPFVVKKLLNTLSLISGSIPQPVSSTSKMMLPSPCFTRKLTPHSSFLDVLQASIAFETRLARQVCMPEGSMVAVGIPSSLEEKSHASLERPRVVQGEDLAGELLRIDLLHLRYVLLGEAQETFDQRSDPLDIAIEHLPSLGDAFLPAGLHTGLDRVHSAIQAGEDVLYAVRQLGDGLANRGEPLIL